MRLSIIAVTPQYCQLIFNLLSLLCYYRYISRLKLRHYLSLMVSMLNRVDAVEIIVAALVDAIFVKVARSKLKSHIAVDVLINGIDQFFIDLITSESCTIFRPFLESTLARLPPTLSGVYSVAMIFGTTRLFA